MDFIKEQLIAEQHRLLDKLCKARGRWLGEIVKHHKDWEGNPDPDPVATLALIKEAAENFLYMCDQVDALLKQLEEA